MGARRTGIIPLDVTSDMGGPLARTVEDAVRLFEVTVGIDPSDNYTSLQSAAAVPANYTQFLDPNGLKVAAASRHAAPERWEGAGVEVRC